MKIILNDYGCYPFILQLAKSLAQRKHIVNYMFAPFIQNPMANYKDLKSNKNFSFHPIKINKNLTRLIILKSTHYPTNKKPHECGVLSNNAIQLIIIAIFII